MHRQVDIHLLQIQMISGNRFQNQANGTVWTWTKEKSLTQAELALPEDQAGWENFRYLVRINIV